MLQPQPDFPTNRGGLCSKGWTAATLLDHPQRLLTPLLRTVPGERSSPFRPASWDEAFAAIVTGIGKAQQAYGRDAVGCFGGGGLTNEKAYALGKFARVALRTAMIDYNGRFCMSSAATAANRAFGVDRGLPFPLADIAEAEAILLVGSNPAATMPPAMQWFDAGREKGATHIVVDPRRTATANGSSVHLAPLPGTDLALANGLLHLAIRDGLVDERLRTRADPRVRRRAHRGERLLAGPGGADHRHRCHCAAGDRSHPGRGGDRDDPHRPGGGAAQQRHRDRPGLHQPRPGPRAGRPTVLRLRHHHRTGQRPGWSGARAEGRPAAGVPQARRPAASRVRRRRLGDRPRRVAPAGPVGLRDARRGWAPRAGCEPCW